ncbi:MAG: DNA polymerase I, partial [Gemmatimonadetes bacterium]|nr:DNA polymerase I [Gemmatimonadota bacterium]
VRLSRRLVTIQTDAPIELDLERLRECDPEWDRLRDLLIAYEFRTLIEKLPLAASTSVAGEERPRLRVAGPDDLDALADALERAGAFELQTWSTRDKPVEGSLVGVALLPDGGDELWYLPLGHRAPGGLSLGIDAVDEPENLPALDSPPCARLRAVLEAPASRVGAHDAKDALVALEGAGIALAGLDFDAMVASYVLDPSRRTHDLDALALDLLGETLPTRKSLVGTGKSEVPLEEVPVAGVAELAAARTWTSAVLHRQLRKGLEDQQLLQLFDELEMPLVPILAEMESTGIKLDEGFFREMSVRLARELRQLQDELFKIAGAEFNLNSTPQLREVLFDRLGLPVIKRTKTGPSTDSDVLEELAAAGHAFPLQLLEYRQLEKLRSTYVDAFPRLINPRTKRLHTRFNQAVAATGRLSSSEPNLQNIPIRTALGREIRKGFVADPGYVLLAVDYSQIELRILAHFSGDDAFVDAFRNRVDVHRQTAAVIFEVPIADVSAEMRAQAKTINFATLYGQGDFSLARQLGIERTAARAFIDAYFERFSGVRSFLDEQIDFAKRHGYVETLAGRRRYVPELQSSNWNIRQFGERVAQNTPIQGTAADLIKKAMIDVHDRLHRSGGGARMLLQVHDELVFE